MSNHELHWIINYIWGIADDVLRGLYVRGKYRDVVLPMTVLRRLDAVLEETKPEVLRMKASLDEARINEQDPAPAVSNSRPISRFTLTGSLPTCKTFLKISSFATRFLGSPKPTLSGH